MSEEAKPKSQAAQRLGAFTIALSVVCIVSAGLTSCARLGSPVADAAPVATTALVLKIVDGDTVDIVDDNRGRLRIRLLGIDTPETKKPNYSVACWGPQASEFATQTLLGQRVAMIPDPTQDRTDRYGRTLAYLDRADGWDYSVEAARAGVAHSYVYHHHPVLRADQIDAAEQEAKAARRGLWGPPCYGRTVSAPN